MTRQGTPRRRSTLESLVLAYFLVVAVIALGVVTVLGEVGPAAIKALDPQRLGCALQAGYEARGRGSCDWRDACERAPAEPRPPAATRS